MSLAGRHISAADAPSNVPNSALPFRTSHFEFHESKPVSVRPLGPSDIHLWHAHLEDSGTPSERLAASLSNDERQRMARFRFERDWRAFAFARGMLRRVLASYLGMDPRVVRFSYSQHGKPSLAPPQSQSRVEFNLSHTAGYILIAICLGHTIGVDVEKLRSDFDVEELATRFFSPAERRSLKRLPKAERPKAFFYCWTRKESLLKARGGGLLLPLEDFDVSMGSTGETVKLETRPDPHEAKLWIILNVDVPDEYAAAVTVGR